MFINLFGDYLVKSGKLSCSQLKEISNSQGKIRVKLGLIGVSEKILTEKQAEEINRKQAVLDKRFGDIAIELGYLTGEQLSHLLDLQGNAYMVFCQLITDKGFMELSDIDEAFEDYMKTLNVKAEDYAGFKADDIDVIIPYFVPGDDSNVAQLIAVAIRTINRLVSTDIYVEAGSLVEAYTSSNYAFQELNGDMGFVTCFDGDGIIKIASAYAHEDFEVIDADTLDAVAEFINIINGLFATALSYNKINIDMAPPILAIDEKSIDVSSAVIVAMKINGADVKLIVGKK